MTARDDYEHDVYEHDVYEHDVYGYGYDNYGHACFVADRTSLGLVLGVLTGGLFLLLPGLHLLDPLLLPKFLRLLVPVAHVPSLQFAAQLQRPGLKRPDSHLE